MEYLHCKARLVAVGHVIDPPATINYASIVSRETFSISLTLDALNDFPVNIEDIQNANSTSPDIDKIWKVLGPEFGEYDERKAIVVHDLYGFKSDEAKFHNHLEDCMRHLGFLACPSELDLWMKPMVRPEDGFNHYAYILIYVYGVMVIHNYA